MIAVLDYGPLWLAGAVVVIVVVLRSVDRYERRLKALRAAEDGERARRARADERRARAALAPRSRDVEASPARPPVAEGGVVVPFPSERARRARGCGS